MNIKKANRKRWMNSQISKPSAIAPLLAVALLSVLLAAGVVSPPGVAAQNQVPLLTVVEVDGGRSSEMVFEVNLPSSGSYLDPDDEILIDIPAAFTFSSSIDVANIRLSGSGDTTRTTAADYRAPLSPPSAPVSGNTITLTVPGDPDSDVTGDTLDELVGEGEHLVITIAANSGIIAPETPLGFDNPDKGYPVIIQFLGDGNETDETPEDENILVVKNPISSTVPNTRVRVELATYAEALISGSEEITVDFSGPSEDAEFNLPSTITKTRITIRTIDPEDRSKSVTFSPSDVLVQRQRVNLTVPEDKAVQQGDYTISFSQLANIRTPFAAGNRIITVSSFTPGDQPDEITAVIMRTTSVSPLEGPRGSQFTLQGKGYAAGTVTVFDGKDRTIDSGETLASVNTSRGSFTARLEARGELGDPMYKVWTRDSNGAIDFAEFEIRSSMSFEPETVGIGDRLKITIMDWEDDHQEVAAVRIGGVDAFTTTPVEYANCLDYPNAYFADDSGVVSFEVTVPRGVPPGEQTVAIYGHERLEHYYDDGSLIADKKACADLDDGTEKVNPTGKMVTTRLMDDPKALVQKTVEIDTRSLPLSQSEAVRGQKITITGSGFTKNPQGQEDIEEVTINGEDVVEDLSRFEVGTNGDVTVTITVPLHARNGDNEVRIIGHDGTLGQATLTVPEPSLTLTPAESRRGSAVRATGSGFIANHLFRLNYGDVFVTAGQADSRGNFSLPFTVPLNARIGVVNKVTGFAEYTDEGRNKEVSAEADHTLPSSGITVAPDSVLPGDTVTIRGENLPAFSVVRPVQIGGRDVTPVPNARVDQSGAFEIEVTVPLIELGEQVVRVEASGVILTHIIQIAEPPLSGPTTDVFRELIKAGSLARLWQLEPSDQSWTLFDPRPEFAEFNTLSEVSSGDFVWVNMKEQHRFQGDDLNPGWNIILLK